MQRTKISQLVALGKHIRQIRLSKGLTQERLADVAGLDRAYYGGVERGERNISALNLIRLAAALNVEVGELFPPSSTLAKKE
jgi:transcriptional regulator with XRE-family HTH domain